MLTPILFMLLAPVAEETPPAAATAAESAQAPLNADAPIEMIAANPAGKAILDKEMPELLAHPAYEQIKALSLRQLQPYSGGAITDDAIARIDAALKTLH